MRKTISQPSGQRGEDDKGSYQQQGNNADQIGGLIDRQKHLHEPDEDKFDGVVIEGHLRLGKEQSAYSTVTKYRFHLRRMAENMEFT